VAGGGTDDGHAATDVGLFGVAGLALDSAGNLYATEQYANLVRKISTDGSITTVAGNSGAGFGGDGGRATRATLNRPSDVVVDANGDLYIADHFNHRVRRIDGVTGIISTFAGRGSDRTDGAIGDNGPAADAVLDGPTALALQGGSLYVAEDAYNGNRIRRIVLATKIITTVAGQADGSSGFSGDGGPATAAKLDGPQGLTVDSAGNIYISDTYNHRVRRVDASSGIIDTYAGGGDRADDAADGGLATAAKLEYPEALVFDRDGHLLISASGRVRRIDKNSRIVSTVTTEIGISYGMAVAKNGDLFIGDGFGEILRYTPGSSQGTLFAGGGSYVGDGLPAAAAVLRSPTGLAVDRTGNLFIADSSNLLVRRVDAQSGLISTFAGDGGYYDDGPDGQPATSVPAGEPVDLAFDPQGNLYFADSVNARIKRVDRVTGALTYYAGGGDPPGGNNEGLLATSAKFDSAWGISFDADGNLYIAEPTKNKVWRVDGKTHLITTFAGTGTEGFSGDGGLATAANLAYPIHAVADSAGNVFIADYFNNAVRKVAKDGTITTIAGHNPTLEGFGDGGPALQAYVSPTHMAIDARNGDLYIADDYSSRVRKIEARSGIITTVAGSGTAYYIDADFSGDNGPARDAKLNFPFQLSGVAVDGSGNVFVADSTNNRVRVVYACVSVAAPQLTAPANGTTNTSTAPVMSWSAVPGAFRYDVRLDTVSPPGRVIASDLTETSFSPSNLQSGVRYFWSVTAKGDQFCPALSTAASSVASFTTSAGCGAGPFDIISPPEGASNVIGAGFTLSWQPSAGVGTYDLYLGATNPPSLVASGLKQTSYPTLTVDKNLFWFVVAHAACDDSRTAATPIHSFSTNVSRTCGAAGTIALASPPAGAIGVSTSTDLTWSVSGAEAPDSFDVYFGTASSPPLLRTDLPRDARSISVSALESGTTYFWRVVGKGLCFPGGTSTNVATFTTRSACTVPGATQIIFNPTTASAGATYTIVWSVAPGLDADGGYLVERSTSASFNSILDSQVTSSTAASFVASNAGTYYHRVRALPSCDPTKSGSLSDVKGVNIIAAQSNIIFTVQPTAVVTSLGDKIEDRRGTFSLENIGATSAQIILGQAELPGSKPFFSIAEGGAFVTLQPRTPRTFNIDYSGPRNDVAGSYQGVIFAVGVTQQLASTPYAFVNLKVGGGPAVAPQFVIDGTPSDYAAFPAFSGDDDSNRAGRDISIRNPGTTPMELGAEIGPDVWLIPENGWNAQPLAAGASRTVKLFTRRPFAPTGSPLPRYTYFTVRTKDGASARLLVQDNDRISVSGGRATSLEVAARSFIVPEAVSQTTSGGRAVTRLRLTNSGGDSVQVELIFTPSGADGFDANAVKRAVIVVPPNDVVTLTDPLIQVFGAADGASGQIEVRVPRERLGLIAVSAATVVLGGGTTSVIPVVSRGEGARVGSPHVLYLPVTGPTSLTIAETTGGDHASVSVVTYPGGASQTADVPRYGMRRLTFATPSRIDVIVDAGGGAVVGVATITVGNSTATVLSRPVNERIPGASLARALWKRIGPNDTVSITTVVPVISSTSSTGTAPSYKTALSLVSPAGAAATFNLSLYQTGGGAALTQTVQVPANVSVVFNDTLRQAFNVTTPNDGNLFVQGPPGSKVYAVLQTAPPGGSSSPTSFVPLPTTLSEAVTSAASSAQKPLFYDGLEQSVDPARGTRWMLLLNELGGASGSVNVRLYEAGNRTRPIAEKDFSVSANQQLKLDTVFGALGLDAPERKKDRTNVQVVVTATGGTARVAATAVSIDNKTADTKMVSLAPSIGSGNPNVTFTAPVIPQSPPPPTRHRGVRH
jgi:sugar lactone lactonase YvrE